MLEKNVTICNKLGLHARAAAKLVAHAGRFSSQITLIKETHNVNAKSIMGVMSLAAGSGTTLLLQADGDDAEEALDDLADLIADRFGEEE